MVIDSSALLAVLLGEPDGPRVAAAIEAGSPRLLSAANLLETSIVIESRKGEAGGRELDLLLYRAGIEVEPVDRDQAEHTSRFLSAKVPPAARCRAARRAETQISADSR